MSVQSPNTNMNAVNIQRRATELYVKMRDLTGQKRQGGGDSNSHLFCRHHSAVWSANKNGWDRQNIAKEWASVQNSVPPLPRSIAEPPCTPSQADKNVAPPGPPVPQCTSMAQAQGSRQTKGRNDGEALPREAACALLGGEFLHP